MKNKKIADYRTADYRTGKLTDGQFWKNETSYYEDFQIFQGQ